MKFRLIPYLKWWFVILIAATTFPFLFWWESYMDWIADRLFGLLDETFDD